MSESHVKALALHITGIVQGVGFRPFVYNLARSQGLSGWVLNASDGVHAFVEGAEATVDEFPSLVRKQAPPMAVIDDIFAEEVEAEGLLGFEIRESRAEEGQMTLVSPDIATCPDCVRELRDSGDRRHRYPFINCTNCGPRFTIIDDVPYDRPSTSMRDFDMCAECAEEYGDPGDRRFHAQPDACFVCGPRLYLNAEGARDDWRWTPECEGSPRPHRSAEAEARRSDAIIGEAARRLLGGEVLAIKGLGGFHLACDATNADAVARLRSRKRRWAKPLAVMVHNLDAARVLAEAGPEEEAWLTGPVRPIVLLRKRDWRRCGESAAEQGDGLADESAPAIAAGVAAGVADELAEIGVMLPYTPLHHLLLAEVGRPLVMTSGNLSDEPIATSNAEALSRLVSIADAFLLHDRAILSRYDDSVVRVVDGRTELVRRARGFAPFPIPLPFSADTAILAVGPEQKNTFTLIDGNRAFVSQHIGDLENAETLESFEQTVRLYERLFRVQPEIIAHDLHPEYLSTKWALASDLPKLGVQHHHAHVVSVTAEHGLAEKVVGFAFDGTGYGNDGRIWGGEVLLADWAGFERFARLAYVPMPGGAAAIRRPARMAIGTLQACGLLQHPGAAALRSRLAEGEEATLLRMIERGVNSPLTSSMGRLFDSVAAIIGIADDARYEGEAAILLEACADLAETRTYEFGLLEADANRTPYVIDPTPVLSAVLNDLSRNVSASSISMRFHRAVAGCIVRLARVVVEQHSDVRYAALAGGVFMNRIVLGEAMRALDSAGITPLIHVRLPMNDGAVSFGQAVVAWAQRHRT